MYFTECSTMAAMMLCVLLAIVSLPVADAITRSLSGLKRKFSFSLITGVPVTAALLVAVVFFRGHLEIGESFQVTTVSCNSGHIKDSKKCKACHLALNFNEGENNGNERN